MRSTASTRNFFVGVLLGVAATLIVAEKTPVGERLLGMTPFPSDQADKTYKEFDHGLPAQLHFQPIPNGVEADGLGTNDIENLGLIVYVTLRGPNGAVDNRVKALVDTGADRSFVSNAIVDGLGLRPALIEVSVKHGLLAPSPLNFYDLSVQFPGGAIIPVRAGGAGNDLQQQMVIGRDILSKGILVFKGPENQATLQFPPPG